MGYQREANKSSQWLISTSSVQGFVLFITALLAYVQSTKVFDRRRLGKHRHRICCRPDRSKNAISMSPYDNAMLKDSYELKAQWSDNEFGGTYMKGFALAIFSIVG